MKSYLAFSRVSLAVLVAVALAATLAVPAAHANSTCCRDFGEGQLADVAYGSSAIQWRVGVEHESVVLTVSGPCGVIERTYEAGDDPIFRLEELGEDDPNGAYSWQIRINPVVDKSVRNALQEARESGDDEIFKNLRRKGLLPQGPFIQSGGFTVDRGSIVNPNDGVEKGGLRATMPENGSTAPGSELGVIPASVASGGLGRVTGEQVISGDLVVYNSICVGFDCPTNPSFGADTIRLQENNLRIHAEDTSTAASFPTTDWRLEFNSNLNGGGSYFRVNDVSANRSIMTLEAGAPSHSLYIDNGGRAGFGTQNPVVELHTSNGDTPTLRLEQNTSSGFAAQTWDVAGNETSFFVRDATNGSTLPFRIRPGASSNSLVIDTDNDVGVGVLSPEDRLHVVGTDSPKVLIDDTTDNANDKPGFTLRSPAAASSGDWFFEVDNGGNFQIDFGPSAGPEILLSDSTASNSTVTINGNLVVNGTCTGCDAVFTPEFELESIEEHAALMWENSFLPAVGPTPEGETSIDVFEKTTGILQELEKAHIYIEQLNNGLKAKDARIRQLEQQLNGVAELQERLLALEASLNGSEGTHTD